MKRIVLGILMLFFTVTLFGQRRIEVKINKNVEFVGLCYWLIFIGDIYDNNQSFVPWDKQHFQIKAYEKFKKYKDDPLLNSLKEANENEGLSSYTYLFLQLGDFPNCKLIDSIDGQYLLRYSDSLNSSRAKSFTKEVIRDLNSFYEQIEFEEFWASNKDNYNKVLEETIINLPNESFILKMEEFYQQETFKGYKIIPSLLIPSGWGFGPTIDSIAFNFLGSFHGAKKDFSSLGFDDRIKLTRKTTHEYGHSFVNHLVDELIDSEYLKKTETLFEPISVSMSKQGYETWKACLYEHFVRAGEILIARNLGNQNLEKELKERYMTVRDFVYLPIILKHLNYYNENKNKLHYIDAMKYALEDLKKYR